MTTYTDVFGNTTVPPAEYGYAAYTLTEDTTFNWPYNYTGTYTTAKIISLGATGAWALTLPSAAQVSVGEDLLLINASAYTITVKNADGNTVTTIAAGATKYLFVTNNSTAAGGWGNFTYGTGTSAADAATLQGRGTIARSSVLDVSHAVSTTSSTTVNIAAADNAKVVVCTAGAATVNLPALATLTTGFFVMLRNSGTGALTVDPNGSETVDGASTMAINPGESAILIGDTSGSAWYSVGYGRSTEFQFTLLVLDVTSGGTFTLTSAQAGNKLLKFIGVPVSDVNVVVPNIVNIYYTQAAYTGTRNLTVKTAAGTGITLTTGQSATLYCDGTNVTNAQTVAASSTVSANNGTVAAPSISFSTYPATGFYIVSANKVGAAANGALMWSADSTSVRLNNDNVVVGNRNVITNFVLGDTNSLQNIAGGSTYNIGIGSSVMTAATTGATGNIGIGYSALNFVNSGDYNVAVGYVAGAALTSGQLNVAVGFQSLQSCQTGTDNTAVGDSAGQLCTSSNNTFLGKSSGSSVTSGTSNVILGSYTGNDGAYDIRTTTGSIALSNGSGTLRMIYDVNGASHMNVYQSATPATINTNGFMTFTLTSNTNLRISVRGSDGTTRVANLTLA